jgi:hypothetical protein
MHYLYSQVLQVKYNIWLQIFRLINYCKFASAIQADTLDIGIIFTMVKNNTVDKAVANDLNVLPS